MACEHTPAPWSFDEVASQGTTFAVKDASGGYIASVWGYDEEARSNVRLITSSPDLLSALQRAEDVISHLLAGRPVRDVSETFAEIRMAIGHATGAA